MKRKPAKKSDSTTLRLALVFILVAALSALHYNHVYSGNPPPATGDTLFYSE